MSKTPPKAIVRPDSARHASGKPPAPKAFCQPDNGFIDLSALRQRIDKGLSKITAKKEGQDEA